jgi:hypothetical protein
MCLVDLHQWHGTGLEMIKRKEGRFKKSDCSGIFRDASEGPAFGERILVNKKNHFFGRFDLSISSHSNPEKKLKSFSSLGHGYTISEDAAETKITLITIGN